MMYFVQYLLSQLQLSQVIFVFATIAFTYEASWIIYYLYVHPLSSFPGPVFRAISFLPDRVSLLKGYSHHDWKRLHDKYGKVVRVSPDELSFNTAQAWRDIYGRRGRVALDRDPMNHVQEGPPIITGARLPDHTRLRKLLSYGFTQSYLRNKEPYIKEYYNQLLARLKDALGKSQSAVVDMKLIFHIMTYEVIGEIMLGDSFRILSMSQYERLMQKMYDAMAFQTVMRLTATYPALHKVFTTVAFFFPSIIDTRNDHILYATKMANDRLSQSDPREDLLSHVLRNDGPNGMTREEIVSNVGVFLAGGSETTAAALSHIIYRLVANPTWLEKVQTQIRQAFKHDSEISHTSVSEPGRLTFMEAAISEGLRLYPPAPGSNARILGKDSEMIDGFNVPGNTTLGVHHWAANRSSLNFTDPDEFRPERWLNNPPERYQNDDLAASQPFTLGASNCIGVNLGWHELRSALTMVLWHFELRLCDKSKYWTEQKSFLFWEKPPLWIEIRPYHKV